MITVTVVTSVLYEDESSSALFTFYILRVVLDVRLLGSRLQLLESYIFLVQTA